MQGSGEKGEGLPEQIRQLVEPVVESEGKELVELEYRRESHGWVLRLFLDQEDGITVEDCARVSRVVGDLLDVADLIPNPYHLEVSSPGLNRPLRKVEHFRSALGKIIEIRTLAPLEGRKKFKGTLLEAAPESVRLDCDGRAYEIPLGLMDRARLCYFESTEE
ncbi:MAG TPA: ribosome maturation factor RimP [Syntrophobacteraceae bacterium]|nr:ribosome maturation factor RimP [Syntrophobacteraceae bacterium]